MKHETIEGIIDDLNSGQIQDLIFRATLTESVEYSKVWLEEPSGRVPNESAYDFFFIKDEVDTYVAAVLDMHNDLHVFVKKSYRGNGYLTRALDEVILPKLFQDGRRKQTVTFKDSIGRNHCTKNLGFLMVNESTAEKDLSCYSNAPKIKQVPGKISEKEFEQIKIKINHSKALLEMIKDKLVITYGDCEDRYLTDLIHDIIWLDDKILNFIEKKQGRLV